MAEDNNKVVVRTRDRLLSLLGIKSASTRDAMPVKQLDDSITTYSGTFSEQELTKLPGMAAKIPQGTNINTVESYLNGSMEESRARIKETKAFKAMTPELKKARTVLVPSIMSPNDVQSDHIGVSVSIPELSDDVNKKLTKLLNDHFNDDVKLGIKITEWIGDALFETGATPVMILPKNSITMLSEATDLENELLEKGEVLTVGVESLLDSKKDPVFEAFENLVVDVESSKVSTKSKAIYQELVDDATIALELFSHEIGLSKNEKFDSRAIATETIKNVGDLIGKYKNGLSFSTDYRSIIAPSKKAKKASEKLFERIQTSLYGGRTNRLFILDGNSDVAEGDHPTLIELSTECVVPVTVPGSKSSHIGYFVMLDQWGNPIRSEFQNISSCSNTEMQAGARIIHQSSLVDGKLTDSQKFEAASLIFGITIRKMLENKLNNNDIDGITVQQHQAISTTLFQRLLKGQRVKVVFVPANLMAYYAFAYRDDGTGKSLLEDSSFLLSLRNTLMIANVMAAIKNSTDFKRIEFDVGESATNVEQLMGLIESIYVNKRMLRFDHNPMSAVRDLIQRSISIVPKGLAGMGNLEVTTENVTGNTAQPDTEMLDMLTELIITDTGVPHSVMNALGENEFSRSIATTNLFFSNELRAKQRIVCDISGGLVRQYTMLSKSLVDAIAKIINNARDVKKSKKKNEGATNGTTADESAAALIRKVINHIEVTLPTPAIAVDKAQYEELRAQIELIESLLEKLYDPELIVSEDQVAKDTMVAVRALMRQSLLRDAILKVGAQGSIIIPTFDDIDTNELRLTNQRILNVSKNLHRMHKSLTSANEEEDSGSSW